MTAMLVAPKPGEGGAILAGPTIGQVYRINLVNVDGHSASTADGRISTLVLVGKSSADKAREVGDRIPDFCLGNPAYRMVTVVAFESQHSRPIRAFLTSMIRRRVESEAKRLQARYARLKIARNARDDVFAMADFDGAIAAQLDAKPSMDLFRVFIFGKNGELLKQWSDVPTPEDLAAALKQN
jgi:hypothetical protein